MRGVEVKGEGRRAFIILLCSYPFLANSFCLLVQGQVSLFFTISDS